MVWICLGKREASILDKSIKLISWSKGLKQEIGFGFKNFITLSSGEQYVKKEEFETIESSRTNTFSFIYINGMQKISNEIKILLSKKDKDFVKVLDLLVKHLAYFYIAKIDSNLIYKNGSKKEKLKVEKWVNDKALFFIWEEAFKAISKKISLKQEDLELLTLDEVYQILSGKNINNFKKRKDKFWSMILVEDKINLFLGKDLRPRLMNKTTWENIGNMPAPILETNMKILAWSLNLREEIGFGYEKFIINTEGDYFGDKETRLKIVTYIELKERKLDYILKIINLRDNLLKLINKKKIDHEYILTELTKNFMYYYLSRREAEILFSEEKVSKKTKKIIENFRNKEDFFKVYDLYLDKLSKELNTSVEIIGLHTLDELFKFIKIKKLNPLIEKRKNKPWSLALKRGKILFYNKKLNPLIKKDEEKITDFLRGNTAYKINKKIVGIVGKDILVISMTRPDMVSEMKKKKAIVTDEGGMLCHAAITCREFKIPGIVGTKAASKIFKKGDKIEVDTINGTVRKL